MGKMEKQAHKKRIFTKQAYWIESYSGAGDNQLSIFDEIVELVIDLNSDSLYSRDRNRRLAHL